MQWPLCRLAFLNAMTGGSMQQMSLFALSISPYITASIIMQLMTVIFPGIEEMQKDGIKDRKYQGVLYPDSESYCCDDVLNILKSTFPEFAYILHDKDVDENGELKKPHIHWVGRLKAARYLSALADDLGIAENMIERCRSFDAFIRYLIHADDPDKFHYPLEAVISTFPINKFFRDDEEIQAGRLADYIIDARCSSMSNAVRWALKNGCWGTLRRAGSIWSAVISENRVLNMCESDQRHLTPGEVQRSVFYDPIEQKADFEPERMIGENISFEDMARLDAALEGSKDESK